MSSRETLLIACGYSIDDTPVDPIPSHYPDPNFYIRTYCTYIVTTDTLPQSCSFIYLDPPPFFSSFLSPPFYLPNPIFIHPQHPLLRLVLLALSYLVSGIALPVAYRLLSPSASFLGLPFGLTLNYG